VIVANSFNWCRYNSQDQYSWDGNYAANQVKKDVQTTSSEDLITPALKTISTTKDFCQFVNDKYNFYEKPLWVKTGQEFFSDDFSQPGTSRAKLMLKSIIRNYKIEDILCRKDPN
jgi:hypothetical protein